MMDRIHDQWTDLLSDHLDDELDGALRAALEAHLETCADCRTTLMELRRVKAAALALVGPSAPDDLWAGIASQLGTTGTTSAHAPHGNGATILEFPRRRRFGFSYVTPYAVAAGFALLLVAAGAVYLARPALFGARGAQTLAQRQPAPSAESTADLQAAAFDPVQVEGEIAQLERALQRGRGKLDPKTVQVLQTNLEIIRKATEDAKAALAKDPANRDLQDYFATSVTSKLELMKRATKMAGV